MAFYTEKSLEETVTAAWLVSGGVGTIKSIADYLALGPAKNFHIRDVDGLGINLPGVIRGEKTKIYVDEWLGHSADDLKRFKKMINAVEIDPLSA